MCTNVEQLVWRTIINFPNVILKYIVEEAIDVLHTRICCICGDAKWIIFTVCTLEYLRFFAKREQKC